MRAIRNGFCICGIAAFLSLSAIGAAVEPAAESTTNNVGLDEITVTATKREENLNRVGETVSVITAETLRDQNVSSPADVANLVPGLTYAVSQYNTPVYTLRGVGYFEGSLAAYPAVSVYADEMPFPFMVLAKHAAFDLEQIEVLKGPQGTVFGQNSTGGAINYIQQKPTANFDFGGSLTYGRFNEVQTEAYVNGSLTDKLQARFTIREEIADGWQQSNSRPGDTNGYTNNYMGRLQLAYEPTDTAKFLLNVNGSQDKSQTQAPQFLAFYIQSPVASPLLLSQKLSPMNDRAADWYQGLPGSNATTYQTSLRGDINFAPNFTLTSLTTYASYHQLQRDDDDAIPIYDNAVIQDQGSIDAFYQELRIANANSESLRWLVGANYSRYRVNQLLSLNSSDSSSNSTFSLLGYPEGGSTSYGYQRLRNIAGFSNLEYDVTNDVTLKGGVRYTDSDASTTSCLTTSNPSQDILGHVFYDLVYQGKFGPYTRGECLALNTTGREIGSVAPGTPGQFNDSQAESNVSWLVGVDWRVQPGLLVYSNIAKGYKAGDFATLATSSFNSYLPVKQESVLSYEVGFKATMFDHRVQFNGAAFYYDYKDKQMHTKFVDPFFGVLDSIQNIPKSTVTGAELEITARPFQDLTVGAAFTYTHAYITEFTGINAAAIAANFAGAQIPYTPTYQFNGTINYTHPLTATLTGFANGVINMRSSTVSVVGGNVNPPSAYPQHECMFCINGYTTVDLQVGVATAGDHWRFSAWGKNVFDKYYWTNANINYDTITRYAGMPATFGVTANYRFK